MSVSANNKAEAEAKTPRKGATDAKSSQMMAQRGLGLCMMCAHYNINNSSNKNKNRRPGESSS